MVWVGCLEARARVGPEVLEACPGRVELAGLPVQPVCPAGTEPGVVWEKGRVAAQDQGWGARVELPAQKAR
ncbi:MAG: hypothetical protein ACKOS8_15945 [Gemmataceae bacterium]